GYQEAVELYQKQVGKEHPGFTEYVLEKIPSKNERKTVLLRNTAKRSRREPPFPWAEGETEPLFRTSFSRQICLQNYKQSFIYRNCYKRNISLPRNGVVVQLYQHTKQIGITFPKKFL
ncbi:hypothetical protein HHI36_024401, partial [Cryptolaemus montrouzieri]